MPDCGRIPGIPETAVEDCRRFEKSEMRISSGTGSCRVRVRVMVRVRVRVSVSVGEGAAVVKPWH